MLSSGTHPAKNQLAVASPKTQSAPCAYSEAAQYGGHQDDRRRLGSRHDPRPVDPRRGIPAERIQKVIIGATIRRGALRLELPRPIGEGAEERRLGINEALSLPGGRGEFEVGAITVKKLLGDGE